MASAQDIVAEINNQLASDPQRSKGINATYQFDLAGDGGGTYYVVLKDGSGSAGEGSATDPNTTISMNADDFVDLATGKLDGTRAFMTGKIRIKGDMHLAMKLQSVLTTAAQ